MENAKACLIEYMNQPHARIDKKLNDANEAFEALREAICYLKMANEMDGEGE